MQIRCWVIVCVLLIARMNVPVQAEQAASTPTGGVPDGPALSVGSSAFRFFYDEGHPRRIFFSADSSTLYRIEWTRLTAIDTQTGAVLFQRKVPGVSWYVTRDANGLRLESARDRQSVVIHPRTGKELRTGANEIVLQGSEHYGRRTRRIHRIRNSDHAIVEQSVRGGWWAVSIQDFKTDQQIWYGAGCKWSLSPDGRLLAASHKDMVIVDTASGEVLHRFGEIPVRVGQAESWVPFRGMTWTDDASQIFYTRHVKDGVQVHVFDLATQTVRIIVRGIPLDRSFTRGNGHSTLGAPVVSPNGKLIAHLTSDPQFEKSWVLKWASDGSMAKQLPPLPIATRGYFSPDSSVFWMASPFGVVKYDIGEDRIDPLSLDAVLPVTALSFSQDDTKLFGVQNGAVTCWDVADQTECQERRAIPGELAAKRGRKCIQVSRDGLHTTWINDRSHGGNHVPRTSAFIEGKWDADSGFEEFLLPQCGNAVGQSGLQLLHKRTGRNALHATLLRHGIVVRELAPRRAWSDSVMTISSDGQFLARVVRSPYKREQGDAIDFEVCDFGGRIRGLCKLSVPEGRDQTDRTRAFMIPAHLSDDGNELLVWYRGLFNVFDVPQQRLTAQIKANAPTERNGISPNGHRFIRIENQQLQIVDLYTQNVCQTFACRGLQFDKNAVFAFAGNGSQLAIAIPNVPVVIYDIYLQNKSDPEFDALSLDDLWKRLSDRDSQTRFRAVCSFIRRGKNTAEFLASKFPSESVGKDLVLDLVSQLNNREFQFRRAAQDRLHALGSAARIHLRKIPKSDLSLEQQTRIESLVNLRHSWPRLGSTELAQLYALEILQVINSPESRQVLLDISQTHDGRIGRQAKSVLGIAERH